MSRLSRRGMLQLAGGAGMAALAGCGTPAGGPGTGELLTSKLPLPPKFGTPLPIPPTAQPVRVAANADHYVVTQRVADVHLLPDRSTRIWGFDGVFPGPTFRARRGRPMVVTVRNELPVPTSTHLHGGVTPAESDGFPTDLITPAGYSPAPRAATSSPASSATSSWSTVRHGPGSRWRTSGTACAWSTARTLAGTGSPWMPGPEPERSRWCRSAATAVCWPRRWLIRRS